MQTNSPPNATHQLDEVIARLGIDAEFAALPQSLAEVLSTPPEAPDAFEKYHQFLQREQGYAARVLSLANSPALGSRIPIRDLTASLTWLGTTGTRGAILGVAVMEVAKGQPRLLLQAVSCAVFCARVARLMATEDAGTYFVAGLLHNLGKVLMVNAEHGPGAAFEARLIDGDLSPGDERGAWGCTHGEVGAWFAIRWQLPRDYAETILQCDAPPAEATTMTKVVSQGRVWVKNFDLHFLAPSPAAEGVLSYFEKQFGIVRADLLAELDNLSEEVAELTPHLHADTPTLEQTVRMVQQANVALGEASATAEVQRRSAEEQMRHLRLLQELAATTTDCESVEAICDASVKLISKRLGLGVVSIQKPNTKDQLYMVAGVGVPKSIVGQPDVPTAGRIAQRVFDEGAPVLVKDFQQEPGLVPSSHAERYSTASALSVPLLHGGRVLGVLNLNNKVDRQPFHERDLQLFETIGHHLGSFLHAEEQRARRVRSEGRFRAMAAATPAALVGFDEAGVVWLWNNGVVRLTGIPEEEALGKPLPEALLPEGNAEARTAWMTAIQSNEQIDNSQCVIHGRNGRAAFVMYTVVPLEGGRFGVWMGIDISREKAAQQDAKKRAIEIAAMNRVMTRILGELDRPRMLAIFMEEVLRAAAVEKGALLALTDGVPTAVLVAQGFSDANAYDGLLAWTAGAMPEATTRHETAPKATDPAAADFLSRENIRDAAVVRLPVPVERGFVLMACNTASPAAAENAIRVLEDMATVAAIGLRVASDLDSRVRYEQLRIAASMAITYNHEVNNALQVIQAAVDFANRAGGGIDGDDLKEVEKAIHVIQKLNEALGSQFVPAFTRYADGSDMIDARAAASDSEARA